MYDKLKIYYAQKFNEETKETIPADVYETIEEVACSRLVHRVILNLLPGLEKPKEPKFFTINSKYNLTQHC